MRHKTGAILRISSKGEELARHLWGLEGMCESVRGRQEYFMPTSRELQGAYSHFPLHPSESKYKKQDRSWWHNHYTESSWITLQRKS